MSQNLGQVGAPAMLSKCRTQQVAGFRYLYLEETCTD